MHDHALDQKTHNCNRLLFVPARWIGADNIFHVMDGEPLPVDDILAAGYQSVPIETYEPVEVIGVIQRPAAKQIITENMERKFAEAAPHSGRFWRIMCQAAKWHLENEWELTDQELCDAALAVSQTYAPGIKRQNPLREAQRALAWAQANVAPKSALERLRDNHRYYLNQKAIFWRRSFK
jgi:hypothetical protein